MTSSPSPTAIERLEKRLFNRFNIISNVMTGFSLAIVVASLILDSYYPAASGASLLLGIGFMASMGHVIVAAKKSRFMSPDVVGALAITDFIAAIFVAVYVIAQGLAYYYCGDSTYLSTHAILSIVCASYKGVVIAWIVVGSVYFVLLIAVGIVTCSSKRKAIAVHLAHTTPKSPYEVI